MVMLLLPSSRAKKLGAERVTVTVTESLDVRLVVFVTVAESPVCLFLSNCEVAVVWAVFQLAGSTDAPASAAASAFAWTAHLSGYQRPTSIARAQKPSNTNMKTTSRTIVWPRSSFALEDDIVADDIVRLTPCRPRGSA